MVAIEPGEFWMGSPDQEEGRDPDEIRHRVRITRGFELGVTEVTQGLYQAVVGSNPSKSSYRGTSLAGVQMPVQRVSWIDAVSFCNALSEMEGLSPAYEIEGASVRWNAEADGYRLPTEAEWEYAARSGGEQMFAGADGYRSVCDVANVADVGARDVFGWPDDWSKQCSDQNAGPAPVGTYPPNEWGLHDMTGNLWEWVWDCYADYPGWTVVDPAAAQPACDRVYRGGSWSANPEQARVANRYGYDPGGAGDSVGFRLARTPSARD